MSNAGSIANFAVDVSGREVPIRYAAADLVNKLAPEGYYWQKRTNLDDQKDDFFATYDTRFAERTDWATKWQAEWDANPPKPGEIDPFTKRVTDRSRPKLPVYDPAADWQQWMNYPRTYKEGYIAPQPYYIAVKKVSE